MSAQVLISAVSTSALPPVGEWSVTLYSWEIKRASGERRVNYRNERDEGPQIISPASTCTEALIFGGQLVLLFFRSLLSWDLVI